MSTWIIAWREIRSFFLSSMAYIVLTAWLLWSGLSFYFLCEQSGEEFAASAAANPLSDFFGGTALFFIPLLVFVPVLTMRLIAEERRSGTLETLLTAPVVERHVVLGKYLAALVFWAALWLPTLIYVALYRSYAEVDAHTLAATYLGIFGIGLYYMAVGVLMSAAAKNQVAAAMLTFSVLGLIFVLGFGEYIFRDETLQRVFAYVSVWGQMQHFARGVVDSRYLVFDVSLATLSLVTAVQVLAVRRSS